MVSDRLRQLRKEKDISQEVLAKILQVSPSTIGMYEQGRRIPDTDKLNRIADYFNVSTDYLLGRTDIRKASAPEDNLTIAAHHNGNRWTQEELDEIERFKEYIKSKRK